MVECGIIIPQFYQERNEMLENTRFKRSKTLFQLPLQRRLTMLLKNVSQGCLFLYTSSPREKLFTLQWRNSNTGWKVQLIWTVLPQGFKNRPIIFGNQLAKELESWKKDIFGQKLTTIQITFCQQSRQKRSVLVLQ